MKISTSEKIRSSDIGDELIFEVVTSEKSNEREPLSMTRESRWFNRAVEGQKKAGSRHREGREAQFRFTLDSCRTCGPRQAYKGLCTRTLFSLRCRQSLFHIGIYASFSDNLLVWDADNHPFTFGSTHISVTSNYMLLSPNWTNLAHFTDHFRVFHARLH